MLHELGTAEQGQIHDGILTSRVNKDVSRILQMESNFNITRCIRPSKWRRVAMRQLWIIQIQGSGPAIQYG